MRIAHVISSPSGIGGAERVMLDLVQEGTERGWAQRVLHPFVAPDARELRELSPPTTYRALSGTRLRDVPRLWTWTNRELRGFRPEIVHVHLFHALVLVASLPRPSGAKLVLTHHHGSRYIDQPQPARELLDRVCGRRYDAVVAVSDSTRALLADHYRYPDSKLWTIPNGWSGAPRPRTGPLDHRIVCVANLRRQKGHDVLLRAFAQVVRELTDAQLSLIGDGPLRDELQELAKRLGIAQQVHFQGSVDDVWPYLADADVFALASHYEPLGIAVLEAMAAGLPVVATRVGGLVGLIEPDVTGSLVQPDDPGALASSLVSLLSSPQTLDAMGAAARARASEHRAERMAAGYFELYDRLLQSRRTTDAKVNEA